MRNIDLTPASAADMHQFFGRGIPVTAKAIAVKDGDRVIGIAGVYRKANQWVMFADLTDELRRHKRDIVRGIRMVNAMVEGSSLPVIAVADESVEASGRMLEHMGFDQIEGGLYVRGG